jgi:hypothetical protein
MKGILMNTRGLCLLLAIAIASPVALAGPTNVPFKGSLATQETLTPHDFLPADDVCVQSPVPAAFKGTTAVIGNASYLGRVSGGATDCISLSNISVPAGNPPSFSFTNGNLKLTAANGDQLNVRYSGTFAPVGMDPNDSQSVLYAITGTFEVKGGTGRFANATGKGILDGLEKIGALPPFQGHLELTGTISY